MKKLLSIGLTTIIMVGCASQNTKIQAQNGVFSQNESELADSIVETYNGTWEPEHTLVRIAPPTTADAANIDLGDANSGGGIAVIAYSAQYFQTSDVNIPALKKSVLPLIEMFDLKNPEQALNSAIEDGEYTENGITVRFELQKAEDIAGAAIWILA